MLVLDFLALFPINIRKTETLRSLSGLTNGKELSDKNLGIYK
jgi:hypothetical protein